MSEIETSQGKDYYEAAKMAFRKGSNVFSIVFEMDPTHATAGSN